MHRRFVLSYFFAVAMQMLTVSYAMAAEAPASPPNILLILSDDHSAAHVGCYGNKDIRTPNLDKLAADGMRFDRAYVTCPQCVPSRASILSGRHPIDIGMTRFSAPLPNDVVTFPELLKKEKGYYAGLCGRSYHLKGNLIDHPTIRPHLSEADIPKLAERLDYVKVAGGGSGLRQETLGQFKEFLGQVPAGKPFFLQLCWSDPHRPLTSEDLPHKHDPASLTLPPFYPDSPAIRQDLAAFYDEVGRMDGDVGTVLRILEERKLAERTIVIFMGDNGASQLRGKGTLNELGVRIPFIVRWPGAVKPGASSTALVSGDDLAPTLLEMAGVALPENLTGVSFLPLLRGQSQPKPREQVIAERGPHGTALPRNTASFDLGRTIITDRYKLIFTVTWQLPYQPVDFNLDNVRALADAGKLPPNLAAMYLAENRPMFELYDLKDDPFEMTNLAGSAEAAKVERDLKGRLAAWMIHHRDFVPLPIARRPERGAAKKADVEE